MKRNDDKGKKSFKRTVMGKLSRKNSSDVRLNLSRKNSSDVRLNRAEKLSRDLENAFSHPDTISYVKALLAKMDSLNRKIQAGDSNVADEYHTYEKAIMSKLSNSAARLGHDVNIKSEGGLEFVGTVGGVHRRGGEDDHYVSIEDSMSGLRLEPSSFAVARVGRLGVNGEVYDGAPIFNRGDNVTFLYSEPYDFNRNNAPFPGPSGIIENSVATVARLPDGRGDTRRVGSVPVPSSTSLLREQGARRVGSSPAPAQYSDRTEEVLDTEYVLPGDYATIDEIEGAMGNDLSDNPYILDSFGNSIKGQEDDPIYYNVVAGQRYQNDSGKGGDYEQLSSEDDDVYVNASIVGRQRFDGRAGVQNDLVRGVRPLERLPETARDRSAFVGPGVAMQTLGFATGRPSFSKNKSDGRAL